MSNVLSLIGGIGLGAGLMYLLDPDRGRRRRAIARDKMLKTYSKTESAIGTASRDISNRATGVITDVQSRFMKKPAAVSAKTLTGRVRSKLGRVVSHPRAIQVAVRKGQVTLRGPILAHEVAGLISAVEGIPGVLGVQNMLEQHETADVPALYGGRQRTGERMELLQHNWSPAARVLTGLAGGALAFYGSQRRDILGATLGSVGLGLITRSVTNTELRQLTEGIGGGALKSVMEKVNGDSLKSMMHTVTDKVSSITSKVTSSSPEPVLDSASGS